METSQNQHNLSQANFDPGDFCDVQEAAQITGLAEGTLYCMAAQRRGPTTYLFGHRLRYRRQELMDWFFNKYITVRQARGKQA
ncbi:MAG: helix-turn-helix domain-containing protein [Sedimentisphaerales bacterium]|nr:helix-turn-helix domain-containing protein [Sedimentisphaerales bacterium]